MKFFFIIIVILFLLVVEKKEIKNNYLEKVDDIFVFSLLIFKYDVDMYIMNLVVSYGN